MSFRDFLSNWKFRKGFLAGLFDGNGGDAPANPSQNRVEKLVARLLIDKYADDAFCELKRIGAPAIPTLLAALRDSQYRVKVKRSHCMTDQPLDMVLDLLVPHCPDEIIAEAQTLIQSPAEGIRKKVALHLASLGRDETIPVLAELLNDVDGYVRSYVSMGAQRALAAGRCSSYFRSRMYELMLPQCDQEWNGTINDAAEAVLRFDPERAAIDFSNERWLSTFNPFVYKILENCNQAEIRLPEPLLRKLWEHSFPQAVGENCYPNQYVAAGALGALALSIGEAARPLLETALTSDQEEIQEAAAEAICKLSGTAKPFHFVCDQLEKVGYESLTEPQRGVGCAFWFDAEVCNGGLMQFFANSSGVRAADTLEALRLLNHPEGVRALEEAMRLMGPLSRDPDQDRRLSAFEGQYDKFKAAFEPLEAAFFRTNGVLRQKALMYASNQIHHFI